MGHGNVQWDWITNRDIITDLLSECNKGGITLMKEHLDGFRSGPAVCGNLEEGKDFIKWLMEVFRVIAKGANHADFFTFDHLG
mmetsp:Transcript_3559/g.4694  ORF Transcript_3559/g.4694 Transcript_3559/m.4694 type:complete len:83 (+) Transcript_3559:426-674(+)